MFLCSCKYSFLSALRPHSYNIYRRSLGRVSLGHTVFISGLTCSMSKQTWWAHPSSKLTLKTDAHGQSPHEKDNCENWQKKMKVFEYFKLLHSPPFHHIACSTYFICLYWSLFVANISAIQLNVSLSVWKYYGLRKVLELLSSISVAYQHWSTHLAFISYRDSLIFLTRLATHK